MDSRTPQPSRHLDWIPTGRSFPGWVNIIIVAGIPENKKARQNMQRIWLRSWMSSMNGMITGSFIFSWIHLQKVLQKRSGEQPGQGLTIRY